MGSTADADPVVPGRETGGLDEVARKTYRYLRVSVVALAVLLGVSLLIEIGWGGRERFGSISDYYYSPVRSILVGALVAIGPVLISIKGREGWEDTMLDLAGMLAPVVALVPAPLPSSRAGVDCPPGVTRCIPPEFLPSVQNNIAALVVLGAAALVFTWLSAGSVLRRRRSTRYGFAAACGVWFAFAGVFVVARDFFMTVAHYAAAVPFFVLIAGVAYLNGRHAPARRNVPGLTPHGYGRAYRMISGLMILTLTLGAFYYGVAALAGVEPWFATIAVVEGLLLVLFVVFWVLQTAENWHEEAVAEED